MTDPSSPLIPNRYQLRTFGTLCLLGPDEAIVLGHHGHHRRRLALLAMLSAVGDRGWTRDQLLLFFWPESSQTNARHSLEQLLYALRSSLGEDVFAATNPVSLNPASASTDVGAFNEALAADDLTSAIRVYSGPFLEGFYLDNAPEFERWVEEERARLTGKYTRALERLAQASEASGDDAGAIRHWRALVDTDQVSVRNAVGLMRALIRHGDHAAALQFAEQYEATVARELGTSAGPAIAALVAEARAEAGTNPVATRPLITAIPARDAGFPVGGASAATPAVQTPAQRTTLGRRIVAAVLAIATILLTGVVARNTLSAARTPLSIAVLPLANLSGEPRDAQIVDALTEEMTTAIARVTSLRVTARTSAFMFRNSTLGAKRIADSLGVTHLVEGGIQRSAEKYRVNVRLVDAKGVLVWTHVYEPTREEWYTTQGEIASAVARALNIQFGVRAAQQASRRLTENIAANELYQLGRDPLNMRSDSAPAVALRNLHGAVALDSNFAAAYAAMPFLYFSQLRQARTAAEAHQIVRLAEVAAQKALALDPMLPESHIARAVALAMEFRDMGASEAALQKALSLGGAPRVKEHLGRVLMWTGRHAEALEQAIEAEDLDPLSPSASADVGEGLCVNRRIREGLAKLQALTTLRPGLSRVPGYQAVCYLMQGDWNAAVAILERQRGDTPWTPLLGYALVKKGDTTRARILEREAVNRWQQTGQGAIYVAVIAAAFGERDKAFAWLDRVDAGPYSSAINYPLFADLQTDPRFDRFRQKIGMK